MNLHNAIAAGLAHLFQNRLRAVLSILGIFIGISSVLCMMAIGDGAKKIIVDDLEKLGGPNQVQFWTRTSLRKRERRYPTTERYTLSDAHAIEVKCPNVLLVLPKQGKFQLWVTTRYGHQTRAYVAGVTADYASGIRWEVQHGRFLSENDIDNALQVCVLGANAATELFGETSPLGQEARIQVSRRQPLIRCRVVGVMVAKGNQLSGIRSLDNFIYIPLTTHQQRLSGTNYVERLIIFFEKNADIYDVTKSVREVIRQRHQGKDDFTGYWIPKISVKRLEHVQKVIKITLGSIAGFSLLVSGIGIMNICLVSVGEKTREIGLRKSVGAHRADIFWQFLTESICLYLCGAFFGIAGGWFFAHGMARIAVRIVPVVPEWPVVLSVPWIVISVLFSIGMGIIFGVYPAIRAAWMSPIDALRSDT